MPAQQSSAHAKGETKATRHSTESSLAREGKSQADWILSGLLDEASYQILQKDGVQCVVLLMGSKLKQLHAMQIQLKCCHHVRGDFLLPGQPS